MFKQKKEKKGVKSDKSFTINSLSCFEKNAATALALHNEINEHGIYLFQPLQQDQRHIFNSPRWA